MVETYSLKKELEKWLYELQKKKIFSYYTEIYNENGEIEGFQVFVPYEDIDVIKTDYEKDLEKLKVFLSPAVEKKILKKFLEFLKDKYSIEIGNGIKELSNNGFAVYLNWTNKSFVVHKYENGEFRSKTCKKTPFWETDNGVWITGLKDCERIKRLIEKINGFLDEHFGVEYSINYHRACGAYKECKRED